MTSVLCMVGYYCQNHMRSTPYSYLLARSLWKCYLQVLEAIDITPQQACRLLLLQLAIAFFLFAVTPERVVSAKRFMSKLEKLYKVY